MHTCVYIYSMYIGFDYADIDINAQDHGIKSFLASQGCIYAYMYVCMYVRLYVCMYLCSTVHAVHTPKLERMYVCMCMYACFSMYKPPFQKKNNIAMV